MGMFRSFPLQNNGKLTRSSGRLHSRLLVGGLGWQITKPTCLDPVWDVDDGLPVLFHHTATSQGHPITPEKSTSMDQPLTACCHTAALVIPSLDPGGRDEFPMTRIRRRCFAYNYTVQHQGGKDTSVGDASRRPPQSRVARHCHSSPTFTLNEVVLFYRPWRASTSVSGTFTLVCPLLLAVVDCASTKCYGIVHSMYMTPCDEIHD